MWSVSFLCQYICFRLDPIHRRGNAVRGTQLAQHFWRPSRGGWDGEDFLPPRIIWDLFPSKCIFLQRHSRLLFIGVISWTYKNNASLTAGGWRMIGKSKSGYQQTRHRSCNVASCRAIIEFRSSLYIAILQRLRTAFWRTYLFNTSCPFQVMISRVAMSMPSFFR